MDTPILTTTVYILASLVMASVVVALVTWHLSLKDRKRSREILHREPASKEEGIAVAIEDWKHHHRHAHNHV
jgi:Mg2+/citrate symporter